MGWGEAERVVQAGKAGSHFRVGKLAICEEPGDLGGVDVFAGDREDGPSVPGVGVPVQPRAGVVRPVRRGMRCLAGQPRTGVLQPDPRSDALDGDPALRGCRDPQPAAEPAASLRQGASA